MSINTRLYTLLEARGLSIKQLAEQADLPYRTLQNYLHGVRPPSADALARLCTCTGVDANWLLLGTGEMDATLRPATPQGALAPPDAAPSSPADETERMIRSAEALLREEILPACRRRDGQLVVAHVKTAPGRARALGRALFSLAHAECQAASLEPGEAEELVLVMGVALQETPVVDSPRQKASSRVRRSS